MQHKNVSDSSKSPKKRTETQAQAKTSSSLTNPITTFFVPNYTDPKEPSLEPPKIRQLNRKSSTLAAQLHSKSSM